MAGGELGQHEVGSEVVRLPSWAAARWRERATHPMAIIGVAEALELLDTDDPSAVDVGYVVGSDVGGPASGYT